MNNSNLKISKFNLDEIKYDTFNANIIGKSGSGKKTLIKNIIQNRIDKNKLDQIYVFTVNNDTIKYFENLFENIKIEHELNAFEEIIKIQTENTKNNDIKNLLIIFDWSIIELIDGIQKQLVNSRFNHISYIFMMEHTKQNIPEYRMQIDYIFTFNENNNKILNQIYENYAGMFPFFDLFKITHSGITINPNYSMVINLRTTSYLISEKIKWYKI
jgi:ABC-type dipeptide/oligopeptide/nickel transport system ATPase component